MTQYINVKVKISEGQKEKLQHALAQLPNNKYTPKS